MPLLTVIRHAKSDWSEPLSDHARPLAARGRRQAPETGRWIGAHLPPVDLAIVSSAARAQETWALVGAELVSTSGGEVAARVTDAAYTFDGEDLLDLLRGETEPLGHLVLVGHNPAVEDLVRGLTGRWVAMPTAAVAVIESRGTWDELGDFPARLVARGRPPAFE